MFWRWNIRTDYAMSIEITFKVYYKYLANDPFDENNFETVSLSLKKDEQQRLVDAKNSGIAFGDADSVKDIYDKVLEMSKNEDYNFFISHRQRAVNEMNYIKYLIGRKEMQWSVSEVNEAAIKQFVEEIFRKVDYPEL